MPQKKMRNMYTEKIHPIDPSLYPASWWVLT